MPADVTAIIPNYNGAARLERVLRSLAEQTRPAAEVLVIDNGSTDQSSKSAEQYGARFVRLGANFGFARAVNEGIRLSTTAWVAVLNNDVTVARDWLEVMTRGATFEEAWFAGGRILRMQEPAKLDGSFDLLSRSGLALRAGHGQPDAGLFRTARAISFVPFTAALFRRELFERAGLLDECYGSYLEDVDFGLRCALAGIPGTYIPEAAAWHEGGATLGAWSPQMTRLLSRNQVFLVARHYPPLWHSGLAWAVVAGQVLWGALALRRGVFLAWLLGKIDGLRRWREVRSVATGPARQALNRILASSEAEIRELQKFAPDPFWRVYFRVVGRGGGCGQ